jgi:glycerate-2-kinase
MYISPRSGEGREDAHRFARSLLRLRSLCADGPTDAAGAVADGGTIARAAAKGLDSGEYLENNDAYNFFRELGDGLLITGPTGTNVADVAFLLVGEGAALPGPK